MIFISYSRVNTAIANDIEGHLTRSHYKVFIDYQGIAGGAEFMQVIGSAIQQSQALVLLLSPDATSSQWVRWELGWALQLRKPIVPLLIEPVSLNAVFPLVNLNLGFSRIRDCAPALSFATRRGAQQGFALTSHRATRLRTLYLRFIRNRARSHERIPAL